MNKNRFRLGKVFIEITNPQDTIDKIHAAVEKNQSGYICVSNVRTTRFANKNSDYELVMTDSMMNIPDGMPLIWLAKAWGVNNAQRSNGPTLFRNMMNDKKSKLKHFLLGDTEETLGKIKKALDAENNTNVVGMVSPPFCQVDEYDYEGYVKQIRESGAQVVWTSLGAPKQDIFSRNLLKTNAMMGGALVVIGIGAAFRFYINEYKEPNKHLQKYGLTGFFIRKIDGKALKLYVQYFAWIVSTFLAICYKRIKGIKYYD